MSTPVETYRVGIATADITPPVGIHLSGFAARTDPSEGVYHPLRATAIAIDDGTTPLLLVGAEILGFYDRTERTRQAICKTIDLDPAHIVLNGSHTHCGPATRDMDAKRHGALDTDYVETLIARVAQCARQAWETRTPAQLRFGTGTCDIAVSRRKPDGKGGVEWKPSLEAPHDHGVPILSIESPEGILRGVIFSYACHPTSRGGLLIGGDYVAFAYDRIEETHPGITACFFQGCAGDQKTRPADPAAETFVPLEIDQIRDLGIKLGEAVNRVLASDALKPITGPIAIAQTIIDLKTEPIDLALVKKSLDDSREFVRNWARHLLHSVETKRPVETDIPFEIQTIRFGTSLALVTMAAEITVEYGLRFKKELGAHFDHVLPIAYCNDIIGYVPAKRQIPEGGYEVWFSQQYWNRTGPYVAETEDRIHLAAHQNLGLR